MNLIITYVPEEINIEQAMLDSIEDASSLYDNGYMLTATLLVNAEKININISKNSIINSPLENILEYINKDNLIERLESLMPIKDAIILNGYDIDMEYIRNKIYPLMVKNPKTIISINLIDKDKQIKYPSAHVVELSEDMTDEEWEDKELDLISELEEDIELQQNDNNYLSKFLSALCADITKEIIVDIDKSLSIPNPDKLPTNQINSEYECVSFVNGNNTITIESNKDYITITDKYGNKISLDNAAKVFLSKYLN